LGLTSSMLLKIESNLFIHDSSLSELKKFLLNTV
jgi:hypothetical protein